MKAGGGRVAGLSVVDLAEEATHVLRQARLEAWVIYYAGTLPFCLGFLFFWAEMSQGVRAGSKCAPMALMLALVFVWMKTCQARFAAMLSGQVSGREVERWSAMQWVRVAVLQGAIQPWRLVVLPLALVLVVPLGWALAFFENATVMSGRAVPGLWTVVRKSWELAWLLPRQGGLLALLVVAAGLAVFLNLFIAALQLPYLAQMLFGIESAWTRGGWNPWQSTFMAIWVALAWLLLDPWVKALYGVRCFHGESRESGADLRAELRRLRALAARAAALVVLMASCGGVEAQEAEPPVAESSAAVVRPEALGRAMDDVFQQADFTWRFPRDLMQEEEAERGFWGGLVSGLREALDGGLSRLRKWGRSLLDFMGKIVEWIRERLFPAERARPRPGEGMGLWVTVLPWLLLLLLLGMAAVAGVMAWRYGRRKWARVEVAVEVAAAPDLHDERTLADELPEEEWLRLARELAAQGDLRLALRAWYLGALAHLAQRGLVTIARHKANRDYLHELERRGRAVPEAAAVFGGLVAVFDRVWYGRHLVDDGVLEAFRGEVERIRAC